MSLSEDSPEEKMPPPGAVPEDRVVPGEESSKEDDDEVKRVARLFVDEIMEQAIKSKITSIFYWS